MLLGLLLDDPELAVTNVTRPHGDKILAPLTAMSSGSTAANCDGQPLAGYVRLTFNHLGTLTPNKRFHKATVEVTAAPNTTLYASADFDYGHPDLPSEAEQSFDVAGRGGFWSEAAWCRSRTSVSVL